MKRFEPRPEEVDALGALIAFWLAISFFVAVKIVEWKAGWLWP